VYSRQDQGGGEPSTFGVSGKLWHGVLVMYDRATGSLWSQMDGRAIAGPRKGEVLEHRDSVYTTWSAWKREHPDTLALAKPAGEREQPGSRYAEYAADPERLFLPSLAEGLGAVAPKTVVFGVAHGGHATAVTEDLLARAGVVNDLVGTTPVAWIRDPATGGVRALERRRNGAAVPLERRDDGGFIDARDGTAVPRDALVPLRVDRAYWYGWKRIHRESMVVGG